MKSLGRVLKYVVLCLAGLVAIALVAVGVYDWVASIKLERKLDALRADGQPVRLVDLAHKPIPAEQNAAYYLKPIAADANKITQRMLAAYQDLSPEEQEAFDAGRPGPEMVASLRKAFAEFPQVLPQIDLAAECNDYDEQLDYSLPVDKFMELQLNSPTRFRDIIRVLNYQAQIQLADGQPDAALRTATTMLRLSRLADPNPTLVNFLTGCAVRGIGIEAADRALRAGETSASARQELEEELAQHDMPNIFRQCLIGERAFGIENFRFMRSQTPGAPDFILLPEASNYLDLLAQQIAAASTRPPESWIQRVEAFPSPGHPLLSPLVGTVAPAIEAALSSAAQAEARIKALRIHNAIQRASAVAASDEVRLEALGLPAEALVDPYDGGTMRVKKLPAGWVVYAVGKDLADNGGHLEQIESEQFDVGIGPPSH